MKFTADKLLLYAVTDRSYAGRLSFYEQLEQALAGGVSMIQLREKELELDALIEEAREIQRLCHRYSVPLIINDNVQAAVKSGADGVHVGQSDETVASIRQRLGDDFIIGATAKTVKQAQRAEAEGASYLGVGAVFPSPTKPNAVRITQDELSEIIASVSIPCVAIGGITLDNINCLSGCGISGVAVISSLFAAADIKLAAQSLRKSSEAIVCQKNYKP